jgi:hypothetical protein
LNFAHGGEDSSCMNRTARFNAHVRIGGEGEFCILRSSDGYEHEVVIVLLQQGARSFPRITRHEVELHHQPGHHWVSACDPRGLMAIVGDNVRHFKERPQTLIPSGWQARDRIPRAVCSEPWFGFLTWRCGFLVWDCGALGWLHLHLHSDVEGAGVKPGHKRMTARSGRHYTVAR